MVSHQQIKNKFSKKFSVFETLIIFFLKIKFSDGTESLKDCWICYDVERTDAGPLIQPCLCSGDVASVHHDCLRRWLVEVRNILII